MKITNPFEFGFYATLGFIAAHVALFFVLLFGWLCFIAFIAVMFAASSAEVQEIRESVIKESTYDAPVPAKPAPAKPVVVISARTLDIVNAEMKVLNVKLTDRSLSRSVEMSLIREKVVLQTELEKLLK